MRQKEIKNKIVEIIIMLATPVGWFIPSIPAFDACRIRVKMSSFNC